MFTSGGGSVEDKTVEFLGRFSIPANVQFYTLPIIIPAGRGIYRYQLQIATDYDVGVLMRYSLSQTGYSGYQRFSIEVANGTISSDITRDNAYAARIGVAKANNVCSIYGNIYFLNAGSLTAVRNVGESYSAGDGANNYRISNGFHSINVSADRIIIGVENGTIKSADFFLWREN